MDFEAMLKAIEVNPVTHGEYLSRTASHSVASYFHNFNKSIQSYWIVFHVMKILQNFWLTLVFACFNGTSTVCRLFRHEEVVQFEPLLGGG